MRLFRRFFVSLSGIKTPTVFSELAMYLRMYVLALELIGTYPPTAMSELDIFAKLIRLCRMTLRNSCNSVKVGMGLTEPFDTVRGFRQGDLLSCDCFNFVMESVLRKAGMRRNDIIFQKCPAGCVC